VDFRPWRAPARILRTSVLLALGLTCAGLLAPPGARAAEDQRAFLRLVVNQVDKGEVLVLLRGRDVLLNPADLERAGVRSPGPGQRESRDGQEWVVVSSLAPGLTYRVDEAGLALAITAAPELLATTVLDLQPGAPPALTFRSDPAAFLNYGATTRDFDTFTATVELGVSVGGGLFLTSVTRNEDGSVVRGLTNVTVDDRARLMRWVVGDHVAFAGGLGGSATLGGLSVSREFSINPYAVSFPTVGMNGVVMTPSTADIYVNGHLFRTENLPPGAFQLNNLPVYTGAGIARVIVRDAFGREQELISPYYFTTALLSEGTHEFSYNLGFRRDNVAIDSDDYHRLSFLARHRVGVTDTLTAGGRLEANPSLVSGGGSVTFRLPIIGEFELAAAGSQAGGDRSGAAASFGYSYVGRPVSMGGVLRYQSDHYANLSLPAFVDRARLEALAFVGLQLGTRVNLTAQYAYADYRDRGVEERVSLLTSIRLTDRATFYLNGSHTRSRLFGDVTEGFAGVSYFLGSSTTASATWEQHDRTGQGTVELMKSLPVGNGFGFRVRGVGGEDVQQGLVDVQYQGPYGRYEVAYQNTNGHGVTTASVAGGLMAIGGSVFATRPVYDSFGLIRVPGVAGVRGYLNNQEIGVTNARGDLPVPNMLAYYGNRVAIADSDVPLEYTVAASERTIATGLRGGAVIAFPVRRVQSVSGRVVVASAGATRVPAYGDLKVETDGATLLSPIGRDGEFYLENVPPGRHRATIEDPAGRCAFTLEAPAVGPSLVDLGTITCAGGEAR
jgi:outer membrane usher protein